MGLRVFKGGGTLCAHCAYVNGISRLLAVHSLTNDDDVRGGTSTAKRLVVQTEGTYNIGIAFVHKPVAELLTAVECSVRGDEDTNTTFTELAHVLGNAEVVNVTELL